MRSTARGRTTDRLKNEHLQITNAIAGCEEKLWEPNRWNTEEKERENKRTEERI
jgi:hypothetical protein